MRSLLVVLLLAGAAHADSADQLFQKGKKLLAEKRYKDACATFEKVDSLDPGIGAKLNVAKCYEEWGKLGQAYRWYGDAERMANDTNDKRAPKIHELLATLEPDVPKLTLNVAADADRAIGAVTLDGNRIPDNQLNVAFRLDPGPHEITYTNAAGKRVLKTIPVSRGSQSDLSLELPKLGSNVKAPPPTERPTRTETPDKVTATTDSEPDPGRTKRLIGLSAAGAGLLAVGVASIVTLSARGDYKDALEAHCMNQTNLCDDEGLKATHDARSRANVATVITVIGLAAIGGGAALYFTAPKRSRERSVYVAPAGDGRGVVLGGRF